MARGIALQLNDLYSDFAAGRIDRRQLIKAAGGLGMSAAGLAAFSKAVPASAQDATPGATPMASPVAGGATPEASYPPFSSITRAEYKAKLKAWWTEYQAPAKTGGTLIYGDLGSNNITTFNLIVASSDPTLTFLSSVQEFLIGSSPIDGQYVPGLADSWDVATDGKTYTFHLNQSAAWHDGVPFTADDVVFSFTAIQNPDTGCAYTSGFNDVVASFSKADDHTVQVVAKDVLAQVVFLASLFSAVVPQHIWKDVPFKNWKTDPGATGQDASRVIGTGPFKFVEINESEGTSTLAANTDYYDDKPVVDKFIFQTWPDDTSLLEALRTNTIDFYQPVNPPDVATIRANTGTNVQLYDTYVFSWYGYQLDPAKSKLFLDVKTRQALFIGIDRESIVKNIYLDFGEVAVGTQPVLSIAYAPEQIKTHYSYDPAKAKQLLQEAGWVAGSDGILELNGEKFSFEITYGSGGTNDPLAAYLQQQWKALGVDARPNPVDFDTVLDPILTESHDFQMVMLAFSWDVTGDQSAMFKTGHGFNAMSYSNPQVDQLMEQSNRELDQAKRKQELIEINNIVNEELPIGCMLFRKQRVGYNKRLHNYYATGNGGWLWSLPYIWIDPQQ